MGGEVSGQQDRAGHGLGGGQSAARSESARLGSSWKDQPAVEDGGEPHQMSGEQPCPRHHDMAVGASLISHDHDQ